MTLAISPQRKRIAKAISLAKSYNHHITATQNVRNGNPRIVGRRITVSDIVICHLHQGQSIADICVDYALNPAQVHAALAYYYDHQSVIDAKIRDDREAYQMAYQNQDSAFLQLLENA
ncbi:MAG: DUF433 domain-containing protein [Anaerolineae bacterium]|nr:DUF433 domain-containing protein [Anaerolineae bacterium]